MAYSTLGWQNGQAPAINASNLNHMDQGIADADATATAAATLAGQKMDKVSGGTAGDFAALDANGNVVDSGKSASDFSKVTATDSGGYLTEITIDGTSHAIPSGGGSAGVSSIGGKTGAITLGGGLSIDNNNVLSGPDLRGYVEKLTNTSGIRAYVNSPTDGILSLQVVRADNTPQSIVQRTTAGQIITAETPEGDRHATSKKYVDDNFAPKATNGYAELDANGAVQGLKDVFVDFGNSAITEVSAAIGQKLYNALAKYGFAITTGGIHSNGTLNFDMPNQIIVPYSSTNSSFNFRVQHIGSGSTNILVDTGTFYVVDNTGSIVQDT